MDIDQLMIDSTDLHVHSGPDAVSERRVDALELARQASESGMKHVVVKSHQFCTASMASMINKIVGSPVLIGSLVLNASVGGLNSEAVRVAAKEGAKIIWMPTTSARAQMEARSRKAEHIREGESQGISVIDGDGNLVPEVQKILDVVKANDLVLATGHISAMEIVTLAGESLKQNIKTILTHPLAKGFGRSFSLEQAIDLAQKGAFVEFCFNSCMPPMRMSPLEVIDHIKALGADQCVLSTDFGQAHNPPPTEGFRMMLAQMVRFGLSESDLETMIKTNPDKLLSVK